MIGRSTSFRQLDLRTPVLALLTIIVNSGCDWASPTRLRCTKMTALNHPRCARVLALGSTGIPRSGSLLVQIFLPTLSAKLCVGKADRLSSYLVWLKTPLLWLAVCASGLP